MKRFLLFLILIAFAFCTMGMGSLGGTPEGSIPIPDKEFDATVKDVHDVSTKCSFVSISGKDFLKGKRGSASITIPFENIKSITISLSADEKDVDALLALKDGKSLSMKLDGSANLYGKTDYGTLQIKVREVKTVEFSEK